ncbi:hypothetical protein [Streptococcus henryi]|uniref:hypothetical protein n=1 Tax=Streptococcus henryi TaxID=439219 RepID=UPI000944EE09|nr:hypothetical protein [Streptococcus henryi]
MILTEYNELGAYLPAISLPAFINNLTVKNGVMGYAVTSFEQFTKHIEIYEILGATLFGADSYVFFS